MSQADTTIALSVTVMPESWQMQTAEYSLLTAKLSVDVRYHSCQQQSGP